VPLAETDMPMADGLVLLAAHLGEGAFMLDHLDASWSTSPIPRR
jgi:hypothetical protein